MLTVLQTKDLTKSFGKKVAVDHVSMTIHRGDIYGFIGRNGAGKTTFMRMILSLAHPDSGEISLFDGEPRESAGLRIGSLIEAPGLYPQCTAEENLRRFAILYGLSKVNYGELLSYVGLADSGKKKVGGFSLGQKQRMGIAVALLGDPEFLVLDEPINGLDPAGIRDMRDLILRLNQEKGITFLVSSHLLDELSKIATRYGIIHEGRLVEEISAGELAARQGTSVHIRVESEEEALRLHSLLKENGFAEETMEIRSQDMEAYFLERIGG